MLELTELLKHAYTLIFLVRLIPVAKYFQYGLHFFKNFIFQACISDQYVHVRCLCESLKPNLSRRDCGEKITNQLLSVSCLLSDPPCNLQSFLNHISSTSMLFSLLKISKIFYSVFKKYQVTESLKDICDFNFYHRLHFMLPLKECLVGAWFPSVKYTVTHKKTRINIF